MSGVVVPAAPVDRTNVMNAPASRLTCPSGAVSWPALTTLGPVRRMEPPLFAVIFAPASTSIGP
jgi:hypothetical protein